MHPRILEVHATLAPTAGRRNGPVYEEFTTEGARLIRSLYGIEGLLDGIAYSFPDSGYTRYMLVDSRPTVQLMAWAPGTVPWHAHWNEPGLDPVLEGRMGVARGKETHRGNGRYRIDVKDSKVYGPGDVAVIDNVETTAHTIDVLEPSLTLHWYIDNHSHMDVFRPQANGLFRRERMRREVR